MTEQLGFVFDGTTDRMALPEVPKSMAEQFRSWRLRNPRALKLFEDECLKLADSGATQISARDVVARIRWSQLQTQGDDYKCNNNWARFLSDWICEKHPKLKPLFVQRDRPSER